jgi:hypothetical protein
MGAFEAPCVRSPGGGRHELALEGLAAVRAHDFVGRLGGAIRHMAKLAEN